MTVEQLKERLDNLKNREKEIEEAKKVHQLKQNEYTTLANLEVEQLSKFEDETNRIKKEMQELEIAIYYVEK